jgi:hypothetical protein
MLKDCRMVKPADALAITVVSEVLFSEEYFDRSSVM